VAVQAAGLGAHDVELSRLPVGVLNGWVPQSGSADPTGQGKRLKAVPFRLDMQSLNDSGPALVRQRKTICLPSGDHAPLSAPDLSRSSRSPCLSGWIVARVAFLSARELAGHESL
jgi:hypothetical protein